MKAVQVKTSKSYEVRIGQELLHTLGTHCAQVIPPCNVAIISDSNVWPIYGNTAVNSLTSAGFEAVSYMFPAGEESKNANTYFDILNFLAENHITRSDAIIALGGGVVGDMAGFAAATYLRGIAYIQIPTSLLAMVDSSVGGKTAIDLPAGKNLVGAFYQPKLVLCDISALDTLPAEIFRDGCAEVIKYGVLYDQSLFTHLTENGISFDREAVIARCIELKAAVVAQDEFDTGARQKLNLGHTIGHSVEALSNFTVSHGQAVAIGMAIIARSAAFHGLCSESTCIDIIRVLEKFSLPTKTERTSDELHTGALSDKKRTGGTVNLIVPEKIGNCIVMPVPIDEMESYIKAGL